MRTAVLAVVAVVAVVGGIVFGISRVADVSPLDKETPEEERAAASAWEADAGAAFGGADLSEKVVDMMEGAREWQAGQRPTEQFRAELGAMKARMEDVQTRLKELRPFPYDERVNRLYADAAVLYEQAVAVFMAMLDESEELRRGQLDRMARRVRILGDRVFDRGRELVRPRLHEALSPDVEVRLPQEVPDWVQEGIAPGPPLTPADSPPPSGEPRLRAPSRPSQGERAWLEELHRLPIPTHADVRALSATFGYRMASEFTSAASLTTVLAVPDGDRERAARVGVGLLVEAEAVRARQLGQTAVSEALLGVGARLAVDRA